MAVSAWNGSIQRTCTPINKLSLYSFLLFILIYSSSQQQSLGSAPSQDEFKSKDKSISTNNKGGKEDFNNPVFYDFTTTTYDMDNIYDVIDD